MLTIYAYNGTTRAIVKPDESSELVSEVMGVDVFNLQCELVMPVNWRYGDYIVLDQKKYRLNTTPKLVKNAKRKYEYTLTFDSDTQQLGKAVYLFLNSLNKFTEPDFSITGKAYDFLDLLIKNLNRIYPNAGYVIGAVVDSNIVTMDFSANNCLEVLGMLAEKFETEWFIDGNKINLYKREVNSGITMKYGINEGLYQLTIEPQTNSNPLTRVYGYGGSRNIGSNYRGGARRLRMKDSLYLEKNTGIETGLGNYDIIEAVKIFEDIYPRRNGKVTSVSSPFVFSDSSMDFNLNDSAVKIPDVSAKVTFNSGQLSGYTFEISNYNHSTKTFTINKNTEDETIEIPSLLLQAAIGDEYVILDVIMPEVYILNAETELKFRLQEFLDGKAGEIPPVISAICDPIYFKETGHKISLGQIITVQDDMIGINRQIRVIGFTRNYMYPSRYTLKLADTVKDKSLIKIINAA